MERTKEEADWRASRPIGTWSGAAFMAEIAAFVREERKDREAYLDIAASCDSRLTSAYANMVYI
jgi:hypothetical protein